jgi:hypothetical protein
MRHTALVISPLAQCAAPELGGNAQVALTSYRVRDRCAWRVLATIDEVVP